MIRYALICHDCEAEFDAWFASSTAYDEQAARYLIACPQCHGTHVVKQIMAPSVAGTKKSAGPDPQKVFGKLAAAAREHVAENFDYVGEGFAAEATAMHYGEIDNRPIWGDTTQDERDTLKDEGVPAEPLHPAFVPKKQSNKKLN